MNAMGHNVPTMIGVDHRGVGKQINSLIPDYMVMGERGMADMAEMEMPIPDNTARMMTGVGPFGSIEMGGMFSMLKVRKDQKPGDYQDPGWYSHPPGTVADVYKGALSPATTQPSAKSSSIGSTAASSQKEIEVQVRKPTGHSGH
jgi:manganese oxidase